MKKQMGEKRVGCRQARGSFRALAATDTDLSPAGRLGAERHLETCLGCAREYRVFLLSRAALDAAAAPEAIEPGEHFYAGLRARILRGPEADDDSRQHPEVDESWAAALTLTARQLIPAMAMLLVLIIGATLLLERSAPNNFGTVAQPRDSAMLGAFEYPVPSPADELETLVSAEEKENGK